MSLTPGKIWGLKRLADENGRFKMLAVDQRPPIKNHCAEVREEAEARYEDVRAVKRTLLKVLGEEATATLADPHYALADAINHLPASAGLIGTLEDSQFIETPEGRVSREIDNWSVDKIRRVGCDGVKVLTWYRPDATPANIQAQKDFSKRVGEACVKHDIPYIFELLLYPLPGEDNQSTEYKEMVAKRADQVVQSVHDFSDDAFAVDLFKLESPIPAADLPTFDPSDDCSDEVNDAKVLFGDLNEAAWRPWVMLSAGANQAQFANVLDYALSEGANGFLAGRAIWWEAFSKNFPDIDAMESDLRSGGLDYFRMLSAKTDAAAEPWFKGSGAGSFLDELGADFRATYSAQCP